MIGQHVKSRFLPVQAAGSGGGRAGLSGGGVPAEEEGGHAEQSAG